MSLTVDPAATLLAADDLSVELGGLPVLRRVSLAVHAGETVALLGGNGSGKSTLVRAVLGLVPTRRGTVELFGEPLPRFRRWARVGYVPQRTTAVQSGATVREVVASGRLARRTPFVPRRRRDGEAVAAALELVGMAGRSGDDVRRLSGGQQQRVMIARALAGEPDLLVLDEPTAGVDLEHQRVLADVVRRRMRTGVGVLVVLHEVGELGPLVDRAVVLREGRVVHDGDPGRLRRAHPGDRGRHEHSHPSPDGSLWPDGSGSR
jgi:zinc transport system ATP-binding protein